MNTANCLALSKVETRIAIHLTNKDNASGIKKSNVKTSPTLLSKFLNPETKEFYNLKCVIRPIAKVTCINNIAAGVVTVLLLLCAMSSKAEGNINEVEQYNKVISALLKYAAITVPISLPFIVTDAFLQDKSDKYTIKKEKERIELEEKYLEEKTLKQALRLLNELKKDKTQFKYTFAKSILNNVDISHNTPEYNEKLLILLSKIAEGETEENLSNLANHLDSQSKVNNDNASKEFLNNKVVKQLVKSYKSN